MDGKGSTEEAAQSGVRKFHKSKKNGRQKLLGKSKRVGRTTFLKPFPASLQKTLRVSGPLRASATGHKTILDDVGSGETTEQGRGLADSIPRQGILKARKGKGRFTWGLGKHLG